MSEYRCKNTGEDSRISVRVTLGLTVSYEDFWKLIDLSGVENRDELAELITRLVKDDAWLGLPEDWLMSCANCDLDLEESHGTRVKDHYIHKEDE